MARRGKVAKRVLEQVGGLLADKRLRLSPDVREALRADAATWKNFEAFSAPYKRIRLGYIEGARDRPAEFAKRLRHFVEMTKKNRLFGFGGIEKHY